jgi:hypothetical protein
MTDRKYGGKNKMVTLHLQVFSCTDPCDINCENYEDESILFQDKRKWNNKMIKACMMYEHLLKIIEINFISDPFMYIIQFLEVIN